MKKKTQGENVPWLSYVSAVFAVASIFLWELSIVPILAIIIGIIALFVDEKKTKAITSIIFGFLVYFLGGYLLYSALFAAVGAAVDSEADTQQFMFPVIIPIIIAIIIAPATMKDPDGNLAFWASMIPFTSPINMMIRIPFGVPLWQIIVSVILLFIGFLGTTWVAARIYRVGILMYGKKTSFREIGKWIFYKG